MANIGASQAFYRVETSLTRANTQVNNSMVRLSTGKQQANAGDNSSYVAMGATFKVDYDTLVVDELNGRVGIGTLTPSTALHVIGDVTISGNLTLGGTGGGLFSETDVLKMEMAILKVMN